MRTNLEKFEFYYNQLKKKRQDFIDSLNLNIPAKVYNVKHIGTIEEFEIKAITYREKFEIFIKPYSRNDIATVIGKLNSTEPLSRENIQVTYEYLFGESVQTSSFKLDDISKFLTKEEAEKKSLERKEIMERENYLLKNKHTRCQRCGKIVPDADVVSNTIFGRGRKNVFDSRKGQYVSKSCVTTEPMKFCSSTCAANEQMSREG